MASVDYSVGTYIYDTSCVWFLLNATDYSHSDDCSLFFQFYFDLKIGIL